MSLISELERQSALRPRRERLHGAGLLIAFAVVIVLALVAGLVATARPASAAGSDGPTPYTVTAEGITLPAGVTFPAHGHVNWKTSWAQHGVHFDPNNNQPGGKYIGKSFLPFNLEPGECVTWTQVHGWDYHFGAQGEEPICKPKVDEPPVVVEPPVQPEPTTRTKTTDVCKAASRVTDHYSTPFVWSGTAWAPGKEAWSHKTTEPLTAAECGHEIVVREKVTIDCKGGVKNLVITDFYTRTWTFDAKAKSWVLGPEAWSHKTKTPASGEQCPPPVEPTPEPTEPPTEEPTEPPVTEDPTEDPTDPPATEQPSEEPTTEEPTEEPTPVPSEPTDPPVTTEPEPEPSWTPPSSPSSPSTPSSPEPSSASSPVVASPAPSVASPNSSASSASTPTTSASSSASSVDSTSSRASSATAPELARTGTNPIAWAVLTLVLCLAGLGALAIRRRSDS